MTRSTRATPAGVPRSRAKRTRRERRKARYERRVLKNVATAKRAFERHLMQLDGSSFEFDYKHGGTHEQAS
jgi:hypothetical protein